MATSIILERENAPPSYEATLRTNFLEDEIQKSRREISCTECCIYTLLFMFFSVSLSMIIIGGVHYHDCPAENEIPILLIVGGCFGCLIGFFFIACCHGDERPTKNAAGCLLVFVVIFVLVCSVYVYKTQFQTMDSTKDDFCNYYIYWFAFWIVTLTYTAMGLVFIIYMLYVSCGHRF